MSMSKEEIETYLTNSIPKGFQFEPEDVELVGFYLKRKINKQPLPPNRIWEVQLYKYDPDTLAEENTPSNGKWYFFTPRDRKYVNGSRPDRSAGKGYWKATGSDKPINFKGKQVGWKRTLVYYRGKQPKGEKTNWIMHEFVLSDDTQARKRTSNSNMKLDEWVLCRIYKKEKKKEEENPKAKVDVQEAEVAPTVSVETETQTSQKQEYGNIPPPQFDQHMNVQPQQSYEQEAEVVKVTVETETQKQEYGNITPPQFDQHMNVQPQQSYEQEAEVATPLVETETQTQKQEYGISPGPQFDQHLFQAQDFNVQPQQCYYQMTFQDYNLAYCSTSASTSGGLPQFPESYYDPAPAPTIYPDDQFQFDYNFACGSTSASTSGGLPQFPESYYDPAPAPTIYGSTSASASASTSRGFPQFPESYYDSAPAPTIPPDNPDDHFHYYTDPQTQHDETSGIGFTEEEYIHLTTAFGFGNN